MIESDVVANLKAFDGCWMSRGSLRIIAGSMVEWPDNDGGKKMRIQVEGPHRCSAVDRHGKTQHGLLAKDGQLIIWSWGQVWIRKDAKGLPDKSATKRKRSQRSGSSRRVIPATSEQGDEVDGDLTKAIDIEGTMDEDPMVEAMARDFSTFDKMMRNLYGKVVVFLQSVENLVSNLRTTAETISGGAIHLGDPEVAAFSRKFVSAINQIVSLADPLSAISKLRRDITFNILDPMRSHILNNTKIRESLLRRRQLWADLEDPAQPLSDCQSRSAKTHFNQEDERVFEWLVALREHQDDIVDSVMETLKSIQSTLFTASAHAMAKALPVWEAFRPLSQMTPSNMQTEVEGWLQAFGENGSLPRTGMMWTARNTANLLVDRLVQRGYPSTLVCEVVLQHQHDDVQAILEQIHSESEKNMATSWTRRSTATRTMDGVRVPLSLRRPVLQQSPGEIDKRGSETIAVDIPSYWNMKTMGESHCVPASEEIVNGIQFLMNKTWVGIRTCDRRNSSPVPKYKVVDVTRNENIGLWRKYFWRRERLRVASTTSCFKRQSVKTNAPSQIARNDEGAAVSLSGDSPGMYYCGRTLEQEASSNSGGQCSPSAGYQCPSCQRCQASQAGVDCLIDEMGLVSSANEFILFHGTSPSSAQSICRKGFDMSYTGSHRGTLYGRGFYFAEASSKADEYAESDIDNIFTMLMCRVACGICRYSDEIRPDPHDLVESVTVRNTHHSVLGDREKAKGTYREFVIYEEDQAYPEYIVHYRRFSPT
jgi:hypothetical protein